MFYIEYGAEPPMGVGIEINLQVAHPLGVARPCSPRPNADGIEWHAHVQGWLSVFFFFFEGGGGRRRAGCILLRCSFKRLPLEAVGKVPACCEELSLPAAPRPATLI